MSNTAPSAGPAAEECLDNPGKQPGASIGTTDSLHEQNRRGRRRRQAIGESEHHGLFLSVFLLLLAFFALLVSKSEIAEERVDTVLRSIQGTFDGGSAISIALSGGVTDLPQPLDDPATDLRSSLERMPAITLSADPDDLRSFRVALAPEQLFEEPRAVLRQERFLALGRIAESLRSDRLGSAERVAIILEGPSNRLHPAGRAPAVERLMMVRDKLVAFGAPRERLEIGLREAAGARWLLEIYAGWGG